VNELATAAIPQTGEVVAGKYRLERLLGEGGMGIVYEALHLRLRQRCAIKFLHPNGARSAEIVARFEREARAAATLRHPNVVQVLDVDVSESGVPYMVMELLEGQDLSYELEKRGALPIEEAVGYAIVTCRALAHAHDRGVIHRDLKPSNLFICSSDRSLKLLDFGISKIADEQEEPANVTSSITVVGTPYYMSPEQVRSLRNVDHRTDIWALGIVLYELITNHVPYEEGGATAIVAAIAADPVPLPRTHLPSIPAALETVIMGALQKDSRNRFRDARAFAEALLPFGGEAFEQEWIRTPARISKPEIVLPLADGSPDSVRSDSFKNAPTVPVDPPPSGSVSNMAAQPMVISRPIGTIHSIASRMGRFRLAWVLVPILVLAGVVGLVSLVSNKTERAPTATSAEAPKATVSPAAPTVPAAANGSAPTAALPVLDSAPAAVASTLVSPAAKPRAAVRSVPPAASKRPEASPPRPPVAPPAAPVPAPVPTNPLTL
jgi:serine/threonine-protein kinase